MSTASASVAPPRLFGLSPSGFLSLAAVLAVLLVVSLPRLQGLARLENESDACATAELLVRALARLEDPTPDAPLEPLVRRVALERTLADGEWLEQGRLLRRHGYLFELCPAPPPLQLAGWSLALTSTAGARPPRFAVRAWPWSASTGRTVFVASECGTVLAHANSGLRWSGLERHPDSSTGALTEWRRLP